ncbi:bifunctional diguanylate cyclase/phosphodiesterase [Actinotalea sp. K2]|uniref:putative bifunctional diguanylate cyclase/phosphodiesterase n=1 Tax=Actinotalea sp. K2 TaxID=2939438 RepID=UPI002017C30B|nr:EAL domain-containing protein [Actinotalea sp. K2]MCL3860433.1 EAL domain-containing protein [Actinotalea sp. K2]
MSAPERTRGSLRPPQASALRRTSMSERLRLLEPLACLALAAHGLAVQLVAARPGATVVTWAALVLATVGCAGLLGWRGPGAAVLRAVLVLVGGYVLMALKDEGSGYFLLWYFVLVAVYPLVLPRAASRVLVLAVPLAYLALVPLDAADGPVPVALLRAVSLVLIGVFVHWAATAYRQAVTERDAALATLNTYVAAAPVGLGFWGADLRHRWLNTALAELAPAELDPGGGPRDGLGSVDTAERLPADLLANLRRVRDSDEPVHDIDLACGERTWSSSYFPVRIGSLLLGVGAAAVETTAARQATAALNHSATHDGLTGLPNRVLLADRLGVALAHAERSGNDLAVLFCDLDRFKVLNDSLGHVVGDDVLRAVADRLVAVARPGDTVARLGGDEFAVLCPSVTGIDEARALGARVRSAVREPLRLVERTVTATVSVGVALCAPGRGDVAGLLRDADVAMYQAKDAGRDRVEVFDVRVRRSASERFEFHAALRRAVDRGEITVAYQPVLSLRPHVGAADGSPTVIGLEALARWDLPGRGDVPPSVFIPMAEDLGLIHTLGEHVLRTACTAVRTWRRETGLPLTVAVNISARQLESGSCAQVVAAILEDVDLPASALVLEVTESVLMLDVETSHRQIAALRALGVTLAMDDFGTGYSSLAYLRDLPMDVLKIDRSFTSRLPQNEELFVFMVELARALGATTVVEGVETAAQLDMVSRIGCDHAQGYYLSRPMSAQATGGYLRGPDRADVDDRPDAGIVEAAEQVVDPIL